MQPSRPSPFATFSAADWVGLGTLAAVLAVIDSVFLAIGRHDKNVSLFVVWFCIQAFVCIAAGTFQGLRHRRRWEIVIVGAIAAVLLAFIGLLIANSDPGSADCPGQASCDTSFGFGAIVIAIVMTPIYTGIAGIGRLLGGLAAGAQGSSA